MKKPTCLFNSFYTTDAAALEREVYSTDAIIIENKQPQPYREKRKITTKKLYYGKEKKA